MVRRRVCKSFALFLFAFFLACYSGHARADANWLFKSKDSLGIGYSDNASLTSTNVNSDTFIKVSTINSLISDKPSYTLDLSYTSYSTQVVNNVLNYNLTGSYEMNRTNTGSWDLYGSVLGQDFTRGSPETTESGFSYFGLEAGLEFWNYPSSSTEWDLNPGVRFQDYTDFSNRIDNSVFLQADLKLKLTSFINLKANSSFTLAMSSLPDYSRSIFDLGGGVTYDFRKIWQTGLSLLVRMTNFFSRAVSTQTVVVSRRGERAIGQATEVLDYFLGEAFVSCQFAQNFAGKVSITSSHQSSLSGLEDFNENELLASVIATF